MLMLDPAQGTASVGRLKQRSDGANSHTAGSTAYGRMIQPTFSATSGLEPLVNGSWIAEPPR